MYRKLLFWSILLSSTVLMLCAAVQVNFVEDITNFFPKQQKNVSLIFENLPAKDKFVVMFTSDESDINALIDTAEDFAIEIESYPIFRDKATLSLGINDSIVELMSGFVYDNLPILLDDNDFNKLVEVINNDGIKEQLQSNYNRLFSPIGGYISDYIYADPLSLGSNTLGKLQNLGNNVHYTIIDNYIFSQDEKTLLCYITPNGKLNSSDSKKLVDAIESAISQLNHRENNVLTEYFGAAAVAAYNAHQIKIDSMVTLNIAILIVLIFITIAFKSKYSILIIVTPVIYGGLFALALIYFITGEISLIAVGSGSVIFGIALSYSIHVMAHANHCHDIKKLIAELAYPLTIGSFTTIGAFAGLLFTNSKLLQDFGLFASLTLVGTTLFVLIFLPHFLSIKDDGGKEGKLLRLVDNISKIQLDKNKPLVWSILCLSVVFGAFFCNVGFDSNMMNLNYEPLHLEKAEKRLNSFIGNDDSEKTILFIASGEEREEAIDNYSKLCYLLDSLQNIGKISSYSSVDAFLISDSIQSQRLKRWNDFWQNHNRKDIYNQLNADAVELGFDADTYSKFNSLLFKSYSKIDYHNSSKAHGLFSDWINSNDQFTTFTAQVKISETNKAEIYDYILTQSGIIAADRAFFVGKIAEDVSNNFYLILYISGVLIFLALILSYGRLELTLISFTPMFISWILILGVMSLLGIEFNIVTIILSTFIFGIGDDFSIFIMDGLLSEYKDKTSVLTQHKTAIFFSAFAVVIGMGALVFAQHPALHSLGFISLVGIVVVVLVAYTIQPFIFRLFITSQTSKGGFPFTLLSLLKTIYAFCLFLIGCLIIQLTILLFHLIPVNEKKRKILIHKITYNAIRIFIKIIPTVKVKNINEYSESFKKPAVIIANHQSFVDILILLSLNPKMVMLTNGWVWHSPFFGKIVRYLNFCHTGDGYDTLVGSLKDKVKDGYSIVIFPEGTRSVNCRIKRFHKGAFYLAEQLNLDIIPILLYGNGLISSKQQPFYIKKGIIVSKILKRIAPDNIEYGNGYRERTKLIGHYFRAEYNDLYEEYNRVSNSYFKDAIIKNYIYKGPVIEWYMRIKLRMEDWYDHYDRLLPREGLIIDLGCGYGALSYMLSMLSNKRQIIGVDYDQQKIALAQNCFAKNDSINFVNTDLRNYDVPVADGYIISDVLHYVDYESQRMIIEKCIQKLNKGGKLIIRDGDTSLKQKHKNTEKTEKWSTKIVRFNKTDGPLHFLSRNMLIEMAREKSMDLEIVENNSSTSNTLFIFKHQEQ